MTRHFPQTALLIATLLYTTGATAIGKVYLDQTGLEAKEVIIKLSVFKTGGSITLKGWAEGCPSGLSINKKTQFTLNGKKVKRRDIRRYSGRSAYVKFYKATKSVILINWK